MDTHVRTPLAVFNQPQKLVVPLFQRPYVWDEENQWAPLWQDVRRLAEYQLSHPGSSAAHFLGAIVIQAMDVSPGALQSWAIIDGQQRLTTLQLLLDATAAVLDVAELDQLQEQLQWLTHNASAFVVGDDVTLKLRHTNRDREAFDEVMLADPPVDYADLKHRHSLVARAHAYFFEQVRGWLHGEQDAADLTDGTTPDVEPRARLLVGVLTQCLQLVVIDLKADENSQEIFETLNARGTPLTAADLIKNFVFQRLAAEGVDTAAAYVGLWPFDDPYWETEVSVGRVSVTRGSLFLNQWLVSRTGEEVGPKSTFTRFKYYVEHEAGRSMSDLLGDVKQQAVLYRRWNEKASESHGQLGTVELHVYRTDAADTQVLKPWLLWLTRPGSPFSAGTVDGAVQLAESWLMRRLLLRLPSADHGRVVADLIRVHSDAGDDDLGARVESYLARLHSESTYWPADDELRRSLSVENVYRRFKRGRLRMVLEAVEDGFRGYADGHPSKTGARVARNGNPIEHLLPQKWREYWPVDDLAAEVERDNRVHRLGNLTLITQSLNSSVSNGPWLGVNGKWAGLHDHDVLLMNRRVRDMSEAGWTEALIDQRTAEMIEVIVSTWPAPEGHVGAVAVRAEVQAGDNASLKDLVARGVLTPGTQLRARAGKWGGVQCVVLDDGDLLLDDTRFSSPSGAGRQVRGRATNGWFFWSLPDGRRLNDLRGSGAS
ncbi:MAG: DUF4357 domain-containing protein [Actinobacteria bacterium]|nr:DUF4357 domain-containing protein [Actinomycetota bacterium]